MNDPRSKFQIPRDFSPVDFVIEPSNNGFSNFEQSPSYDKGGEETNSLDRTWTSHFGQILHKEQTISSKRNSAIQSSKKLCRPTERSLFCWLLLNFLGSAYTLLSSPVSILLTRSDSKERPSLKIKTASAIFWINLGIFRDYGLKNGVFLGIKLICFSR